MTTAAENEEIKSKALDVYDACHEKVKQQGQTKDTWKNCVGTAAGPLLIVTMGPFAPAGQAVVEEVAGWIYDLGSALGFSNAEEEARMHAEQSAAWASYKIAWENVDKLNVWRDENGHPVTDKNGVALSAGDAALISAYEAVAKMRKEQGLPPKKFFFFRPRPSASAFYSSIGVGPGDSSPDAGKIVTYAWREHSKKFFDDYAAWFSALDDTVKRAGASIAIEKGLLAKKPKPKKSIVPAVLAVGAAAAAAWWLLPAVLLENPLPAGSTLRKEGDWWVLRFREGGYREFRTKREAESYLGGLAR